MPAVTALEPEFVHTRLSSTDKLTYSRVVLEKLMPSMESAFITDLTRADNWYPFCQYIYLRFVSITSLELCLGIPRGFFTSKLSDRYSVPTFVCPIRAMSHIILLS